MRPNEDAAPAPAGDVGPAPARLPDVDELRVGLVGPGRAGAVLAGALEAAGVRVVCWSGRPGGDQSAGRRRMAELAPTARGGDLASTARAANLVLLAVPDRELAGVIGHLAADRSAGRMPPIAAVWHVSGAVGLAPLRPLTRLGTVGLALHPAMTFTGARADLPRLAGVAWARTTTPGGEPVADRLIHALAGRPVPIADDHRGVYHAALSHASNFLTVIEAQAADLLAGIGVAEPRRLLRPLAEAALANAFADPAVYTGPLSRGDDRSVAAHLELLAARDPDALVAYASLTAAALRRAQAAGVIAADDAARVRARLGRVDPTGSLARGPDEPDEGAIHAGGDRP